jgi:hypothetical protein
VRPQVILAIGWSLFVLYAYPGAMTEEAFAGTGMLHAVWRALDWIVVAPFSVVALQAAATLAGANAIARRYASAGAAALAACAALLCAPMLGGLAVVSSHALAVALALLGGGLALRTDRARWAAALPFAVALLLVFTAGDATVVDDRQRLAAAGIAWSKTPLQRAIAHAVVTPRGLWLWLTAAASVAAATALAARLSPRARAS